MTIAAQPEVLTAFEDLRGKAYAVLDTETTGLKGEDQICEISILCGQTNELLLDTLVKPTIPIPDEAIAIHGITNEMVADAPTWAEVYPKVVEVLTGKIAVIYNAQFDLQMMYQSNQAHELQDFGNFGSEGAYCAMLAFSEYKNIKTYPSNRLRGFKLIDAYTSEGLPIPKDLTVHRAAGDVTLVQILIQWRLRQQFHN